MGRVDFSALPIFFLVWRYLLGTELSGLQLSPVQIHRGWIEGWEVDGIVRRAKSLPQLAEILGVSSISVLLVAKGFRPADKSWAQERADLDRVRDRKAIERWQERDADALADIYAETYEVNRLILEQFRDAQVMEELAAPTYTEAMRAASNLKELAESLAGVADPDSGGQTYNVIINNYGQSVNKEGILEEDWSLVAELPDGNAGVKT